MAPRVWKTPSSCLSFIRSNGGKRVTYSSSVVSSKIYLSCELSSSTAGIQAPGWRTLKDDRRILSCAGVPLERDGMIIQDFLPRQVLNTDPSTGAACLKTLHNNESSLELSAGISYDIFLFWP